jgi:hypothetical protein
MRKEVFVYTVIRSYLAAPTLADDLMKRSKDIESEISTVPGFIAYYLVKTTDGATTITVCENQTGCDESTKRAANWLRTNMPDLKISAPQITSGEVAFKFGTHKTASV